MARYIILMLAIFIIGCKSASDGFDLPSGNHYDSISPLGIMIRTEDGAVELYDYEIDRVYRGTLNCLQQLFEKNITGTPWNILFIATTRDLVNNDGFYIEGLTHFTTPIVIEVNSFPGFSKYWALRVLSHEFVHAEIERFGVSHTDNKNHNSGAFDICGNVDY